MKKKLVLPLAAILIAIIACLSFLILSFGCLYLTTKIVFDFEGDITGWEKAIFSQRDLFYVGAKASNNLARLPLLEPYELIKTQSDIWILDLENDHHKSDDGLFLIWRLRQINGIAVEHGVIMINTITQTIDKPIKWFTIIPAENIETGFESEQEFFDYIGRYGVEEPKWLSPEYAYLEFKQTGCLPWIPDCQE